MATSFDSIEGFVRTVLGDTDPVALQFSNDILDNHIRLILMGLDEAALTEDQNNLRYFTTDLSNHSKVRVIYRSVLSAVCGQDDHFSYQTPVLSIVRKGGIRQLVAYVQAKIEEVEGGDFPISSDTDLEAIVGGMQRYINDFSRAFSFQNFNDSQPIGIPKT